MLLADHGHITLKEAYLDGTKIEANANRYTYARGKAIKYNRERIKGQLQDLWSYAEEVAKEETCGSGTCFGIIKSHRKYRRFLLRGMEKVEIEAGLHALAHNLKKMANQ